MSSLCNNGTITFPNVNLGDVIKIMNGSKFKNVAGEVTDHDFSTLGNDAEYQISDVYGDITDELDDLVKMLGQAGVRPEISITVFDTYGDGRIVLSDDGTHVEYLDQTDCGVRDATTDELIAELMRRNGSLFTGDYSQGHMKRGFLVPTPLGILHAYPSYDPDYPGVLVDITPTGKDYEVAVSMSEVTETEADFGQGTPHLITRVWEVCEQDDYSTRIVHDTTITD